ncbi:MAG TPA: VWA domain-containing protein [Blastocatellia bacterium]|nr:VWA domain-containing protein [Blastocatellia bacterium]
MHKKASRPHLLAMAILLMLVSLTACSGSRGEEDAEYEDSRAVPAKARAQYSVAEEATPLERAEGEPSSAEEYKRIDENEFMEAASHPLSTFSIDVDSASYSNVRRFINDGQLPPKDAVRIEEMVNYFKYNYPQPTNSDPFTVSTELSTCPWNNSHKLALIGLQGKRISFDELPPNNLVFLIDVSGSMDEPRKLPLLKSAFRMLADQLRENDRVAIVVYAGAAGLVLPSTPGSNKTEILKAIDSLQAGGSTAGGEGIKLAYEIARNSFIQSGNNRVILATDGDFNVGVSSEGELVRLIEEKRKTGIYLTVLGFGTGNLKDSKMEQMADKGNGNYSYIDTIQEARRVLAGELGATLNTIAKDVKIQVEFNPARVKSYRLIGYENRLLRDEDFNDDKKDAGELGAGHSVTALYEIIPTDGREVPAKVDPLKYQNQDVKPEAFASNEMMTVKLRYRPPSETTRHLIIQALADGDTEISSASENLKFAAAVAQFGLLLRDSKFKAKATFETCLDLARQAKSSDDDGYRGEFIELVEKSRALARKGA